MPRQRLTVPPILVRVTLSLHAGEDDDLLVFFAAIPERQRATAIKTALRSGGRQAILAEQEDDDADLLAQAAELMF